MNKPDWSAVFITHYRWSPYYPSLRLQPYGYLLAIGVRAADDSAMPHDPDRTQYYRATFTVGTEGDDGPPLAVINWEYPLNQCGVGFRSPEPDMNAALCHIIKRVIPTRTDATLVVTTVHLGIAMR